MATDQAERRKGVEAACVTPAGFADQAGENPRRRALQTLGAAVCGAVLPLSGPVQGAAEAAAERTSGVVLAATWQDGNRYFVGLLAPAAGRLEPLCRHPVPTRAHGMAVEAGGTVLVAARRPGDWLIRFDPRSGEVRNWFWSDGEHSFNGHVVRSADGRRLFTTETSIETGEGSVAVRDAASLAVLARWPSAGRDPHELVLGPDGGLWVANGGLETRQETGRMKHHIDQMDSSLVRLDAGSGRVTGQWRLADRRLGLRHIAVAGDGTLAIALQAEHDDPDAREAAPVLALWDHRRGLRAVDLPPQTRLAGYGGSVAASADQVAVGCPRAGRVARWHLSGGVGRWQAPLELPEACATAAGWHGGAGWAVHAFEDSGGGGGRGSGSGRGSVSGKGPADGAGGGSNHLGQVVERWQVPDALRLDNHWATVDRAARSGALSPGA